MARAILSIILLTVPIAVAGRCLLDAPAAATTLVEPPPAPAAAAFLQPPLPPVPAAPAILPTTPPTSYYINVTKIVLLAVAVSFLAGCFLCALFIVFVSRSRTQAANGPAAPGHNLEQGPPTAAMENTALQCLSCLTRVVASV